MKSITFILLWIPCLVFGQYDPKEKEYKHFSIIKKNDTIHYHVYAKGEVNAKKGFILFLQGSGSNPLLRLDIKIDTIKVMENGMEKRKIQKSGMLYSDIPFDLDRIPSEYALVLISKKRIPFMVQSSNFTAPRSYFETESLDYRVWQSSEVINDITQKLIKVPQRVIVIGHSEGSGVAAKLGTINKKITHIGYWAGGGNTQYYDFALQISKKMQRGEISDEEGKKQLDALFSDIQKIESDPLSTDKKWYGHNYRRWSKFTEPSINHLLKLEIPIFAVFASKDESVPMESSLLIPIEFIRNKKKNLTYRLLAGYNHSFAKTPQNPSEPWSNEFMNIFEEFISWVERT